MNWYIICIVILTLLLISILGFTNTNIQKYISNIGNHKYIDVWDNELFVNGHKNINYIVPFHNIKKFHYVKDFTNIVLDGEPNDLSTVKADLVITTKKENLPRGVPMIYAPQFVRAFVETKLNPELLVKNNERIVKQKFCCFMYSNCDAKMGGVRDRRDFLKLINIMTGNRVDNLGKCYNDNYKPNGEWSSTVSIYKPYKFVIAFENNQLKGYVTEKLVMPMVARAIPIYLGAPDVGDYFNTKSFINVRDFPNFESCIRYVMEVDKNENLYRSIIEQPYLHNNRIDRDLFSVYYGGKFYRELYRSLQPKLRDFIRLCKLRDNNIRFITFADGKKYKTARIAKEAKDSGFFKEVKEIGPKDLGNDFLKQHGDFISKNPRGYGYWIWKSYIILQNLKELQDGDFLIWSDSGSSILPNGRNMMEELYNFLEKNCIIIFSINEPEINWCKKDTIITVLDTVGKNLQDFERSVEEDNGQRMSGLLFFRKCPLSQKFVEIWYNLACNYHLIDDSPSVIPNYPSFHENRHDQTLISLLSRFMPNVLSIPYQKYIYEKNEPLSGQKPIQIGRLKN